jgi:hypothetical protein
MEKLYQGKMDSCWKNMELIGVKRPVDWEMILVTSLLEKQKVFTRM